MTHHHPHHGDASRSLHDGRADGLEPLHPLDPLETRSCDELLRAMSGTAFSGRSLGEAADLLTTMTTDRDCFVVCTLSGAMTVAKMGLVICRMIERGMVDCVVSTGALMAHGLSEAVGLAHYKVPRTATDRDLYEKGYNRVYDTLEMEQNLNDVEKVVRQALDRLPAGTVLCSEVFCREVGRLLSERAEGPGVLRSAYEHGVPVYVPAFTDSEIGLDVATWAMRKLVDAKGKGADLWSAVPAFNPFLDLLSYGKLVGSKKRLGIFTIGGGVPRNWAQQVGPLHDIIGLRLDVHVEPPRFQYGIRICPEPVHWGGLSGCTYSEGVSWGKFIPEAEGGRFCEVFADATVAWPLLVRGVIERLDRTGFAPRAPQAAATKG
jgi:deoxyhypusine synthase